MTKNILFLCTGNSCRSQMAEALARATLPENVNCYSAGVVAHGMNPNVATVMSELNINLDSHTSKATNELPDIEFDVVVTVCDHAADKCSTFPAKQHIHHPFSDPPKMAENEKNDNAKLDCYRQVRDDIQAWLGKESTQHQLS